MAKQYIVDSTDGNDNILIKPGGLNGPGSVQRDSDLRLYGLGALQWGEGVNENMYRIAETFNCPEKVLGDYNPTTGLFDYNPATDPLLPKDERDLNPGQGITIPLDGQLWYNDTKKIVYVYDKSIPEWKVTSGIRVDVTAPTTTPKVGDFWYDISGSGDPNGCITAPVLKIYDPSHPEAHTDGFVIIGESFVRQCGDWMSGILDMGGIDSGATARHRIENLGDPINQYDAIHKLYVDTSINGIISSIGVGLTNHEADTALHLTPLENAYLDALNLPTLTAAETNFNIGVTSPIQTQLNNKLNRNGDTMDTGTTLTLGRAPIAALEAATKSYVDGGVSGGNFMQFDPLGQGQPAETGDTQKVGNTIQMFLSGTGWVQIWPAQYQA